MQDFTLIWNGNWQAVNWGGVAWRLVGVVITWALVWLLRRYADRLLRALRNRNPLMTEHQERVLHRFLGYAVVILGVIVSLALLDLTPLLYSALTAAGILGIAVGLATQHMASNFVAGAFILTDRAFAIGDIIQIKEYQGTVKDISLRATTLATLDGPVVTIPNSIFTSWPVTNFSAAPERRISVTLSILGQDSIGAALKILEDIARADQRIIQDKPTETFVAGVRDYIVDLRVIGYVKPADLQAVQSDLNQRIVEQFRQAGIRLAVPVRLHLAAAGDGHPTSS